MGAGWGTQKAKAPVPSQGPAVHLPGEARLSLLSTKMILEKPRDVSEQRSDSVRFLNSRGSCGPCFCHSPPLPSDALRAPSPLHRSPSVRGAETRSSLSHGQRKGRTAARRRECLALAEPPQSVGIALSLQTGFPREMAPGPRSHSYLGVRAGTQVSLLHQRPPSCHTPCPLITCTEVLTLLCWLVPQGHLMHI